jgi:hypothetical protein
MHRAAPTPAWVAAMRLRPHRRTMIVWSLRAIAPGRYASLTRARPTWIRRTRRRLRIGALLTVIGVLRFARAMRVRWEPLFLVAGVLLVAGGYFLPVIGLFFPGLLVVTVTLLKGNSDRWRGTRPTRPNGTRAVELPMSASYWAAVYSRTSHPPARCGEGHAPR